MRKFIFFGILFSLVTLNSIAPAQSGEKPLRIFGYFQNEFSHFGGNAVHNDTRNTFNLQQMNVFFQKNISLQWSAFVNFEMVNNFSSSKQWGSAKLEEAWVKYDFGSAATLRAGLQIPTFNNLNAIKNRTPLLPYVVRPIVYEASFEEVVTLEEFVPGRAFLQLYGFMPIGKYKKFDYAVYLGNSPNINNFSTRGQTGVDTTNTFLVGGRVGLRVGDLKMGVSGTMDKTNLFTRITNFFNVPSLEPFEKRDRFRFGADLSFQNDMFMFEAEYIDVSYDEYSSDGLNANVMDRLEGFELDLAFYYATLGFYVKEPLLLYGTYWRSRTIEPYFVNLQRGFVDEREKLNVPGFGFSYQLSDRVRLKAQYARVNVKVDIGGDLVKVDNTSNFYSMAASVFF